MNLIAPITNKTNKCATSLLGPMGHIRCVKTQTAPRSLGDADYGGDDDSAVEEALTSGVQQSIRPGGHPPQKRTPAMVLALLWQRTKTAKELALTK